MIKILDIRNASKSSDDDGGIVGQIVNGVGQVPDYSDLGALAVRFDDLDHAETVHAAFLAAGVAAVLEDHGDKRKHHVILPKDSKLPLRVEFLRTRMELRSRADFSMVRECDGETMADGAECACARLADHGSPEMRKSQQDGLACKPTGFLVGTIMLPGLEEMSVSFSKGSESTVRPFLELEAAMSTPFSTDIGIKTIESKKTGFSWSVPTFTGTQAIEDDGPF